MFFSTFLMERSTLNLRLSRCDASRTNPNILHRQQASMMTCTSVTLPQCLQQDCQTLSPPKLQRQTVRSKPGAVWHLHGAHAPDVKTSPCAGGCMVRFKRKSSTSKKQAQCMHNFQSAPGQGSTPASTVPNGTVCTHPVGRAALPSRLPTSEKHGFFDTEIQHTLAPNKNCRFLAIDISTDEISTGDLLPCTLPHVTLWGTERVSSNAAVTRAGAHYRYL